MPIVGSQDAFEFEYMGRLKAELGRRGLLVAYEYDRAGIDVGVHLYAGEPNLDGSRRLEGGRVWIQAKGIRSTTLSADQIRASESIAVKDLTLEQVRFWYASAEPVYLVLYLEATDEFLASDVRDLVDSQRGGRAGLVSLSQETLTLRIPTRATLALAIAAMPAHRSIRIDGPAFRGRPLGHQYDPLRSQLAELPSSLFAEIVDELLAAYDFRPEPPHDCSGLSSRIGQVSARGGRLGLTYEWTSPLFTEYGYDRGSDWRIESPPYHAHGDVFVVMHSNVLELPSSDDAAIRALREESKAHSATLVFVNAPESAAFGAWRSALGFGEVLPQGLGSLAFNVLTTTNVYLHFVDRLGWAYVNYL